MSRIGIGFLGTEIHELFTQLKRREYKSVPEISVSFVEHEELGIDQLVLWACWLIEDIRKSCDDPPANPDPIRSARFDDGSLSSFGYLCASWHVWEEISSWDETCATKKLFLTGEFSPSPEYSELKVSFGNIFAAYAFASLDACIESWLQNDFKAALAHAHLVGLSTGYARSASDADTNYFFNRATESADAAKRARSRHKEHYEMKAEAQKFYRESHKTFRSNEAAAAAITRIVPVMHRTALKWIVEWKRSEHPSAG